MMVLPKVPELHHIESYDGVDGVTHQLFFVRYDLLVDQRVYCALYADTRLNGPYYLDILDSSARFSWCYFVWDTTSMDAVVEYTLRYA